MSRMTERLIDYVVLVTLLVFAYIMRKESPEISGLIVAGAVQFWLQKNAAPPHAPDPAIHAAAVAAAAVLETAKKEA